MLDGGERLKIQNFRKNAKFYLQSDTKRFINTESTLSQHHDVESTLIQCWVPFAGLLLIIKISKVRLEVNTIA